MIWLARTATTAASMTADVSFRQAMAFTDPTSRARKKSADFDMPSPCQLETTTAPNDSSFLANALSAVSTVMQEVSNPSSLTACT